MTIVDKAIQEAKDRRRHIGEKSRHWRVGFAREVAQRALAIRDEQDATDHCPWCGSLGWTIRKYGRVTHKESCPYRRTQWHQGDPQVPA